MTSLTYAQIDALITIVIFIASILCFVTFYKFIKTGRALKLSENLTSSATRAIGAGLQNQKIRFFDYKKTQDYLSRCGADYMFSHKLTPELYFLCSLLFALFGFFIGWKLFPPSSVLGVLLGYNALKFIIKTSDNSDNEKMLGDIKCVFDTLRIQQGANVYIIESLRSCWGLVKNKRLKKAFEEFNIDIESNVSVSDAMYNLERKFNNEYITSLVVIVTQSFGSGAVVEMLDDTSGMLEDIQGMINEREKAKMQKQVMACQMLVYASIIMVTAFLLFGSLSATMTHF